MPCNRHNAEEKLHDLVPHAHVQERSRLPLRLIKSRYRALLGHRV